MGHHNRHYGGDRHALHGAWSPPTSSANFCEEDYAISIYLAEFINSLTNLVYVYYALQAMYRPRNLTPGSKETTQTRSLFSPKTDFMSISLLILGICSFAFHASMRQTMQFADELAMLGLAWALLQGVLTVRTRWSTWDRVTNFGMVVAFPAFSAFYIHTGKIIYHATVFTLILALIIARGYYFFYIRKPGFPPAKVRDWRIRGRKILVVLIVGYVLWQCDLEFCAQLRRWRGQMGLPWAWVLELHGWWHVFTAFSAAKFMDIVRELQFELRAEEEKKQEGKQDFM
ncbi:putative alkaline ceramidase family protein [Podospora australis]|uniref:Alkaline ceramidase family protein n=1 Tax=Podospora australis TaxID=1536484 RepID=A0AAN7ADI1_9PEZI|nr:putative alkaline ceramidase family protein [Podospora australis]